MDQVGQAEIEAAVKLQDMANAERAAGNVQDAYLHYIGAQLATKMQEMGDKRLPVSASVTLGQYVATVSINGDRNDTRGLAGFSVTYTDSDPDRTRLIALAQQAVGRAAADAGNTLLSFLDNAQARVDVAYANLPAGARTDRMLSVAQRFVDAAYQAAGIGNWNLVQTLETAADLSIQIAAQPEGSRHALTERFMHKNVKHDITVDPNTADPFASFTDHSKGEDIIGAVVEGVVGVVINLAAVVFPEIPGTVALAVAWDTAQAGKNFAEGNILGGFLSLGAAAGVGLNGLAAAGQVAAPGSFYAQAANFTNSFATNTLGFTATATATATQELGQTILAGTALIGGANGIAQSAANGDPLGIAAGVLEVAAAVAGGLISTNTLSTPLTQAINLYAGVGSTATSVADAFKNGDLAGGLAGSLNALLPLIAQRVMELGRSATAVNEQPPLVGAPGSSVVPVLEEDLPNLDSNWTSPSLDPLTQGQLDALIILDSIQVAKAERAAGINRLLNGVDLVQAGPITPNGLGINPLPGPDPLDPTGLNAVGISPLEQQRIADTLNQLLSGQAASLNPHPYYNRPDNVTGAVLPAGTYVTFDVPSVGRGRGPNRILIDQTTFKMYYTNNHYRSFFPLAISSRP